ncbi:uncharacterized protein LOC134552431 isoform X1 [Prinia subflava]|uniref:uncharacterized protein LOC134552431 isoform X1 n=1 Tax=Prinia subflava TaxID=208062 RepID=UPI002FE110DC
MAGPPAGLGSRKTPSPACLKGAGPACPCGASARPAPPSGSRAELRERGERHRVRFDRAELSRRAESKRLHSRAVPVRSECSRRAENTRGAPNSRKEPSIAEIGRVKLNGRKWPSATDNSRTQPRLADWNGVEPNKPRRTSPSSPGLDPIAAAEPRLCCRCIRHIFPLCLTEGRGKKKKKKKKEEEKTGAVPGRSRGGPGAVSAVTAAFSAGDSKALSGSLPARRRAGGRDAMALCPELERSLSLLQPGAGRARQQQERRADAAPTPMVFMCAGCRRPLGDTRTWGSVSRTAVPSCCAVSTSAATPAPPRSLPPCLLPCLPPQLRPPASPRTRGGRAPSSPESADGEGRAWLDTVPGESGVPGAGDRQRARSARVAREPLEHLSGVGCTSRVWPKGEGFLTRTCSDGQGRQL